MNFSHDFDGLAHSVHIAEKYHEPRAVAAFRKAFPGVKVVSEVFETPRYERALEPHPIKLLGWIKSIRAGHRALWIAWNRLCSLL